MSSGANRDGIEAVPLREQEFKNSERLCPQMLSMGSPNMALA